MAAETICPGSCNERLRRAREEYQAALAAYDPLDSATSRPEPPAIEPVYGHPWCTRCASRIRTELAELDEVAALMAAEADGLRGESGEQRVSGSSEDPSPSRVHDDLDELASMVTGWEDAYRHLMGWPSPPRRGWLASVTTSAIAWLGHHLDGILASDDIAADFGSEILAWHREMRGKARAGTRRLRKPMRCPGCQLLTLVWTEGEEYVRCGAPECRRSLKLSEYEDLVEHKAGAA